MLWWKCGCLQIVSYETCQSPSSEISTKWKKLKSFVTGKIQYIELGIFSFNSKVYYLTRGFIASTRALNLLTRAFSLLTCGFELVTRGFEFATRGFKLVTQGFELATHAVELVTRGFQLWKRKSCNWTRNSKIWTRNSYIWTHNSQRVTRVLLFHLKFEWIVFILAITIKRKSMQYLQKVSSNLPNKLLQWFFRSSPPEALLGKGVLKICSKFSGEHPCQSVISIKLQSNSIETTLRYGCSPVNLLHIFRKTFAENTSGGLLLYLFSLVSYKVHQKLIWPFNVWCALKGHTYFCSWKLQVFLSIYDIWVDITRQINKQNDEIRLSHYFFHFINLILSLVFWSKVLLSRKSKKNETHFPSKVGNVT